MRDALEPVSPRGPDTLPRMWPPQRRAARGALAMCVAVCAGVVLSACGTTDAVLQRDLAATRNPTFQILTAEDVARQPAGSPQRVLMEVWREFQFQDAKDLLMRVTGPPVRPRPDLDTRVVNFAFTVRNVRPRIVSTHVHGDTALLDVELTSRDSVGNALNLRQTRVTLTCKRSGGRWRVTVDYPLLRRLSRAAKP